MPMAAPITSRPSSCSWRRCHDRRRSTVDSRRSVVSLRSVRHTRRSGRAFLHPLRTSIPPNPIGLRCPACHSINLLGEAFCEVCGAPLPVTPYLVITETGLRLPVFAGEQPSVVVGRADALSGVFPDVDLSPVWRRSRWHLAPSRPAHVQRRSILDRRPQQRQPDLSQRSTPHARSARAAQRRRSHPAGKAAGHVSSRVNARSQNLENAPLR